MQIVKNTVVTLDYQIRDSEGELVDDGSEQLVYLHGGYDDVFRDIEDGLDGKQVGDKLQVKLAPEEAFGDYDAELRTLNLAICFRRKSRWGCTWSVRMARW